MIHQTILHRGRLSVSHLYVEKSLLSLTTTQTVVGRHLLDPLCQQPRLALAVHLSHGPCRLHGIGGPKEDPLIICEPPLQHPHFYSMFFTIFKAY